MEQTFENAADNYPYPIAHACRTFLDRLPLSPWQEWEFLSRDVLLPVLKYLSHLLLSDLVATGRKPAHLFHRIESILSRPLAGHYVGFLRETARYYKDSNLQAGVPSLVDFIYSAEIDNSLAGSNDPLLGTLVDYRNLFAHGRIDNEDMLNRSVGRIRKLTILLLQKLSFITDYPLATEDGTLLMGSTPALDSKAQPLVVVSAGDIPLRPLLLKLKGKDLVLLENLELSKMTLTYRGNTTFERFTKGKLKRGDGARIFEELKTLIEKVRAIDVVLPRPDWTTFSERASVATDRTLSLYAEMGKFKPEWFVPRPAWQGDDSIYEQFLASDKTLLAISGEQGTGKSALVSHLVDQSRQAGHAVLFINGQRFSFADVAWTGNPYPDYFSQRLHYETPCDGAFLKRVIQGAPAGKQLILFIDAINEVDGIEQKWNRFRAMELMLEWIMEIAQPGLKIVLSFRLDVYEEFEYLQGDEILEGLPAVSFGGNNPRKPWVHDLETFNMEQAQALYYKLQEQPRYGMAPALEWEQLEQGLGEQADSFFTNPLVFMVFLRAHHGEKAVLTNDREKMFERYADKLTGALEAARRPWHHKLWGFIKNGNITAKERFLADLVDKMAEEGGAAFLVEGLNPSKKRDRRMLQVIEDDRASTIEDLKDGGLIVEEKIEYQLLNRSIISKRLTFVGELMGAALETINKKYLRFQQSRRIQIVLLSFFAILPASWFLSYFYASSHCFLGSASCPELMILDEAQCRYMTQAFPIIVLLFTTYFFIVLIITTKFSNFKTDVFSISPSKLGIIQSATMKCISINMIKGVKKICIILTIEFILYVFILSIIFRLATKDTSLVYLYPTLLMWLVAFLILLTIAIFYPKSFYYLVRLSAPKISVRMVKSAARSHLSMLKSRSYRRTRLSMYRTSGVLLICLLFISYLIDYVDFSEIEGIAFNSAEIAALAPVRILNKTINAFPEWSLRIPMILAPLFFVGIIIVIRVSLTFSKTLLQKPNIAPISAGYAKFAVSSFIIIGFVFPILLLGYYHFEIDRHINPFRKDWAVADQAFATLKANPKIMPFGTAAMGGCELNLSQAFMRPIDIENLKQSSIRITALKLPKNFSYALDLCDFDNLMYLAAPGTFLKRLHRADDLIELVIFDPKEYLSKTKGNNNLKVLEIRGECASLGDLYKNFKMLNALRIPESVAENVKDFPTHFKNLVIEITDESPRLAWLTSDATKNILALRSISAYTENLHLIKRLFLDIEGLQDPAVLLRLNSLTWLKLIVRNKKPSKEFLKELKIVIDRGLPHLRTLEFRNLGSDRHSITPYAAFNKEEALQLIQQFINKDDFWDKDIKYKNAEKPMYQIGRLWGGDLYQQE